MDFREHTLIPDRPAITGSERTKTFGGVGAVGGEGGEGSVGGVGGPGSQRVEITGGDKNLSCLRGW